MLNSISCYRNANENQMRYHLTLNRMDTVLKKCCQGRKENGSLYTLVGEIKMVKLLWKTGWWFLKTFKTIVR